MKRSFPAFVILGFAALASSCSLFHQKSSEKEITSFIFTAASNPGLVKNAVGVISGNRIQVTVPSTADIGSMKPTIHISEDADISPASGAAADFSAPVSYTVTAENGTTATYHVTVTPPSSGNEITAFSFRPAGNPTLSYEIAGVISGNAISAQVPSMTPLSSLTPTIAVSPGASVSPASGTVVDFGSPVVFTVTAANGNLRSYTVSVSHAVNPVINEVALPYYTDNSLAIEIFNPASIPIDLSAYRLRANSRTNNSTTYPNNGAMNFDLPSVLIPAGGYALIRGKISASFVSGGRVVYLDDAASPNPHYPWAAHQGGFVELLDSNGAAVDFLRWGSDMTAPASGSFSGSLASVTADEEHIAYSFARDSASTDTDTASDWSLRAWNSLGGTNDVSSDADADNDGIPDCAEVSGGTFAGLPLYAWGARTGQRDIFIHIDYMDKNQDSGHVDQDAMLTPAKAALDKARDAYLAQGIHVHFDAGNLFTATAGDAANYNLDGRSHLVDWTQSVTLGVTAGYGNVYEYKVESMPIAKTRSFFYMLFGSSQNADGSGGSSGLANVSGNASLISFGRWNVTNPQVIVNYQAATIMHEFGHNLGLRHGGNENLNYKPNYFSIMNYLYQLNGLPLTQAGTRYYRQYANRNPAWAAMANSANWNDAANDAAFSIDYSDGTSSNLDEASLDETGGIGRIALGPIDFSNDGDTGDSGVSADITGLLSGTLDELSTLSDYDDWAAIDSVFQRTYTGIHSGASISSEPNVPEAPSARMILDNDAPEISDPCAPRPDF